MKKIEFDYERQRLFPGYDGKTCKVIPSIATDGETVLLGYQHLLLTGSDVFYDKFIVKSTDGGKTWGEPKVQSALKDRWTGDIRTAANGFVMYNKKHKKWFGIGGTMNYSDDKTPILYNGIPTGVAIYMTLDARKGEYTSYKELPFPFDAINIEPMGQIVEFENGDILVPFYFTRKDHQKAMCVTVRYAFDEDNLRIVAAGEPIVDDRFDRGISEPSITELNGKYYMTIRSDAIGLFAVSDDGLHFSTPKPWVWDDGSELENYNTQQHWVKNKDGLFLTYTRRGAHNDHVFRHRAPIFMTRFDEEKNCLVRDDEVILVPELGARLGNYNVIEASEKESWLITAEWMQSWDGALGVCDKYGSDNALWLAKVKWK